MYMEKLLLSIKEDMAKRKITNRMLAEVLPISEAAIGKNLNGKTGYDFFNYVWTVHFTYKDEIGIQKERIRQFFEKNERYVNFKVMFEWASNNGEDELGLLLSKRLINDKYYAASANMYDMLQKRKRETIGHQEFLRQSKEIKISSDEVIESRSLKNIIDIYAAWDLKGYPMVEANANIALDFIHEKVPPSYTRDSHEIRALEMLLSVMIKRNDVIKVDQLIKKIFKKENLELFPIQLNSIYLTMAEFYSLTDYKKSKELLKEAFEINSNLLTNHKKRRKSLEATYDHICISNDDFNNLYLTDDSEKAHFFAKTGNGEEALKIIRQIEKKQKLSAHQKYYKALALKDKRLMRESFDMFNSSGDLFYAQVPGTYLFGKYA
jgi:hypothetical protein